MTLLEQAATALAIRPLLWGEIDTKVAEVLRMRIDGQAYTAIAQTLSVAEHWQPSLAKRYEKAGCNLVLKAQEIAIKLDRAGAGGRWQRSGPPKEV